jgi:hypothetical protein
MASNVVWYAGRCVKRAEHDKAVHLEAVVQLADGTWRPIENPEVLFRHTNDVELRGVDARKIKISDWVAFTIGNKGPRTKSWPATAHRRLHRYLDLSALGGVEEVQRKLVLEGIRTAHPSGTWIVRCTDDEALQVELRQSGGVAHLAASCGQVQSYRFESESVVLITSPDGELELYDLNGTAAMTVYDWAPDEAFVLRVVRAAASANDKRANDLISWLESHTKQGENLLTVKSGDIAASNDALRAGRLAKRLVTDQSLLRTFMDAMAGDDRIANLIKERAERVAEQERASARTRAEAEAKREIDMSRKKRLAALDAELEKKAQERWEQADAEHLQRMNALEKALDKLRTDGEAELRRTLGARAAELEGLTGELAARCKARQAEAAQLEAAVEEGRENLESLRAEAAEAQKVLAASRAKAGEIEEELAAARARLAMAGINCPLPAAPARVAKRIVLESAIDEIGASKLLSDRGKELMAQFLALTLAGEVPALCGPEVDDFLIAAEIMFGGGRSLRMEGDPTIITFEDLWMRAGTNVRSGLGHALATASGTLGEPRTTLAVVERADRSGARFWYPALAGQAQRGNLPRRLLVCVTIEDEECEEATAILERAVRLDLSDVLKPGATIALAMAAAAGTGNELDPGDTRADIFAVTAKVPTSPLLDVTRSARLIRTAAEAVRLSPSAQPSGLLQLFLNNVEHPHGANNKTRSSTHA